MKEINLVLVAMDSELEALLNTLSNYETITINNEKSYKFSFNNEDYILMMGKIGKVHTAFFIGQLSKEFNIKRIFNLGTSGGVSKSLKLDDVVIATKVGYYDVDVTAFGYEYGQVPSCPKFFECDEEYISKHISNITKKYKRGIVISGDQFVNKNNFTRISEKIDSNTLCIEMESGSVGQCAYLMKVPFVIIRSISDFVFEDDNYQTHVDRVNSSTTNSAIIFLQMIGMN